MFKTIKNALKTPDVRKRLFYTLVLIILFRLGCYITVPGVNTITLNNAMSSSNGIAGFIDIISGGAFSRFSIFAMSISPYITASIVVQLLAMIIPSLERMLKEGGEEGKKIMNRYTKIITIILALVEAIGIYLSYKSSGIIINPGWLTGIIIVASLVAGTSLLMWLGEQITSKGIGNGISIIIFIGIISGLPSGITTIWGLIMTTAGFSTIGLITSLGIIIGAILILSINPIKVITFIIFVLILQQVEGNIIYPRVVGGSVGLPGMWVLVAVSVGGSLGGILGMLIGVPIASIIYTLVKKDINKKLNKVVE